jgi:uncharacterized protein
VTAEVMPTPPGWYADPGDTRQLRYWSGLEWTPYTAPLPYAPPPAPRKRRIYPLDAAVAELRVEDPRSWGPWPFLLPVIVLAVGVVVGDLTIGRVDPSGDGSHHALRLVFAFVGELVFGLSVYAGGRRIATGVGWARSLGWRGPRRRDLLYVPVGWLSAFLLAVLVRVIANGFSDGRASRESSNVHLTHVTASNVIVLTVLGVFMAPVIEEVLFRGILLRSLMRRMRFWPACLITTAVFGLGHTYEVQTVLGAVTLALSVGTLSLVNCWLNRLTDRLTPGILVHATFNGVAILILVLTH